MRYTRDSKSTTPFFTSRLPNLFLIHAVAVPSLVTSTSSSELRVPLTSLVMNCCHSGSIFSFTTMKKCTACLSSVLISGLWISILVLSGESLVTKPKGAASAPTNGNPLVDFS